MRRGLRPAAIRCLGPRLRHAGIAAVTVAGLVGLIVPLVDHAERIVPQTAEAPAKAAVHRHEPAARDSAPTPPRLANQLAAARTVALRWPTVAAALADGWTLAAPYVPHVGVHYLRFSEIDGTFDVARPEMLLYAGDSPRSPIAGLAYYVKYHEPTGFAGPRRSLAPARRCLHRAVGSGPGRRRCRRLRDQPGGSRPMGLDAARLGRTRLGKRHRRLQRRELAPEMSAAAIEQQTQMGSSHPGSALALRSYKCSHTPTGGHSHAS